MGASSLLDALDIMFTVIAFGFVVITATFVVLPHRNIQLFHVLVAFWAFGFIAGKIVYNGEMTIHLIEIVTLFMILLFLGRPDGARLQDVLWMVIEWASPSAPFFLVGLAFTGYGMVVCFSGGSPSVFFLGDFGVYFIIIGLIVTIAGSECARAQHDYEGLRAGSSLIVYILVLLVATAIIGNQW
uniref:Uncharacterized protein n=1 Tax=Oryza punctata TaxID=4537 RepID=A0A0E0LPR2_ORYPU